MARFRANRCHIPYAVNTDGSNLQLLRPGEEGYYGGGKIKVQSAFYRRHAWKIATVVLAVLVVLLLFSTLSTPKSRTQLEIPGNLNPTQNRTAPAQATRTRAPNVVSSGEGIIHLYASFSFDQGKEVSSGGDILWTDAPGRYTVWQVDETLLANIGVVDFDAIDLAFLRKLNYSKYRLLDGASGLANGDVFALATTHGNRTKVLIVTIADNIHIRWVTYKCLC